MLDIITAFLAPNVRALTEAEINLVIDEFGPTEIANIVDAYAAQAANVGLDPIAEHVAGQVFHRCGPVIDAIAAIGAGIPREQIGASGQLFRIAVAHQALVLTFPGRSLEEILAHIVTLAVSKARQTSVFSSGSDRRH
ncbi:hypothetical protein FHS25_005190 [Rhizobium laguerreae]|uniref:Tetracyclin repressor-like C-terminal domain-containing protein n=1 Tax=Rhizobium laguerreae TaxID=1076926 RepID=A0ABR6GH58_9HYPH|nr:hypothetical protein [Rhizobium laguerreae]MBB3164687.1 hypothetical protein [Rhizobium laguerreae]